MSRPLFLDSSGIYALADRDDDAHMACAECYKKPGQRFITHVGILLESYSLLAKRLNAGAAVKTISAVRFSPRVEIFSLSEELLEAGWARCQKFADKEWDWIDCVSFEIMERRSLREALSLDHHFEQAGFSLRV